MAIQDNVSIIQTSQGSGSGGWVNYNIFTQLEEPEIKEGIWIQTNQAHQSITTDKNILNEGGEWGSVMTDLPYNFEYGSAVVYNGEIHILGGNEGTIKHYKWSGSSWTRVSTLPYNFAHSSSIVYDKSIYIIGSKVSSGTNIESKYYAAFTSPEKLFNPYTLIIQRGNTSSGVYQTCFSDTFSKIEGENNRMLTGFDDIWYFLETKLDTSSPVYYGDGTKWIKLKN